MENRRTELYQKIENQDEKLTQDLTNYLKTLTDKEISVSANVRTHYEWSTRESSLEVSAFVNFIENGKHHFAADFSIYYNKEDGLQLNVGTCGAVGTKTNPLVRERYILVGKVFENEEEIIKLFETLTIENHLEVYEINRTLSEQKRKEQEEKIIKEEEEISSKIEVGNQFKDLDGYVYEIVKITDKCYFTKKHYRYSDDSLYALGAKRFMKNEFITQVRLKFYNQVNKGE